MINYIPTSQLSITEFTMPFECSLDPNNRWVRLSKLVEWDAFAEEYYKLFNLNRGRSPIDARMALGGLIIKSYYHLSDRDTIEIIKETPYLQFFIGNKGFTNTTPFSPAMFAAMRNKMCNEAFEKKTHDIIKKAFVMEGKRKKAISKEKKQIKDKQKHQETIVYCQKSFIEDL